MATAKLIYASPEKVWDMFYATKFITPDPYYFFQIGEKKFVVVNELEYGRAKNEAKVHKVLMYKSYTYSGKPRTYAECVVDYLKENKVTTLEIPEYTPITTADFFKRKRFKIRIKDDPFWPERVIKTPLEKKLIDQSQKIVFKSIKHAYDVLKASRIKGNFLLHKGKKLYSEHLQEIIAKFLFDYGMSVKIGRDVIVSCGNQSVDCHQIGSGPLKPHQSIVIDVFPQSMKTFYCGDATRTFCKGKPSKELKKMYLAVLSAQEMAIKSIKEGVNGKKVHSAISKFFKECGYETYEKSGHMQGFYHGTGHTLGLEVHDGGGRPLAMADFKLKKGVVTSVEPGLYYTGIGGVRLEELIYVTKNGCEVLGGIFPKVLEIA